MKLKKISFFTLIILYLSFYAHSSVPATGINPPLKTKSAENSGNSKQALRVVQMKRFVQLTPAEYGKIRGKKLNFFEKIAFKISQRRMKRMLAYYEYGDAPLSQKISWLLKGLILGPIAVLLVYLFAGEQEQDLIKWVWIGFAGWVVWVGVVLILVLH